MAAPSQPPFGKKNRCRAIRRRQCSADVGNSSAPRPPMTSGAGLPPPATGLLAVTCCLSCHRALMVAPRQRPRQSAPAVLNQGAQLPCFCLRTNQTSWRAMPAGFTPFGPTDLAFLVSCRVTPPCLRRIGSSPLFHAPSVGELCHDPGDPCALRLCLGPEPSRTTPPPPPTSPSRFLHAQVRCRGAPPLPLLRAYPGWLLLCPPGAKQLLFRVRPC